MKKCSKWLVTAVFALCLGFLPQVQSEAAQVAAVRQTAAGTTSVTVEADAVIGAKYYGLQLSEDNVNWVTVEWSASPKLSEYGLTSGKSYYARVCLLDSYSTSSVIAGTESPSIEVVTAPSGSVTAVQKTATTTGYSIEAATVPAGTNYYMVTMNDAIIGQGTSNVIAINRTMTPATQYWQRVYACRRSSTGYIAYSSSAYDYMSTKTLSPALNTKNFGVSSAYTYINVFYFAISSSNYSVDGWQWEFATPSGKVKKVITGQSNPRVADFIQGNYFKYRVRSYVKCGTSNAYAAWSGYKTIALPKKGTAKWYSKSRTLKVNWSKVSNAKSFDVYISTKQNSGFKKVKNVKANKRSVTISKCGKKRLKKGKTYYIRVVPKAKIGKKTTAAGNYVVYDFRAN